MRVTHSSEYDARPVAVVMHNPHREGAIDALRGIAPDASKRFLFREAPDPRLFDSEFRALVDAIREAAVPVLELPLADGAGDSMALNPNTIYTRDSAITLPWAPEIFMRCAMASTIRQAEPLAMASALNGLGLQELPWGRTSETFLEGGDVIPVALDGYRCLLVGYGPRTNYAAVRSLYKHLVPDFADSVIAIELEASRINLDGAMMPLSKDVVVAHAGSLLSATCLRPSGARSIDALALFRELGASIIEVTYEDSFLRQACNCLCLGDGKVLCYEMSASVVHRLRDTGLDIRWRDVN